MKLKAVSMAVTLTLSAALCSTNFSYASDLSKKIIKIKEVKSEAKKLAKIEKIMHAHESFGSSVVSLDSEILKRNPQTTNAQSILNNAPGISVTNPGPVAARVHTSVRGFNSTEVGYTFDNLPITSFFVGGLNGGNAHQTDSYGLSPITSGEASSINVLYGPPKPSINTFGALAGAINYKPLLPAKKFGGDVFGGYGSYDTRTYGAAVNTGNIGSDGGRLLVRYSGRTSDNYLKNVPATTHSYYVAYVLPSNNGLSKLTAIWYLNNFSGNVPSRMPINLLEKYGRYYQWPENVSYQKANATFMNGIIDYKSALNNHLVFNGKMYYQEQRYRRLEFDDYNQTNPYVGDIFKENPGPYGPQVSYHPNGLSGIEYESYYVNNTSIGINPNITLLYPKISVQAGLLSVAAYSHNGLNNYGTPNVPIIQGYNDYWDEHQHRFYNKIYIQARYSPIKRLELYPGVKYEIVNSLDTDDPGIFYPVGASAGNTYSLPSAYFGASYKLTKRIKIFGNYAIAYKYPNMSAYFGVTGDASIGTPPPPVNVVPEFVNSYQLGISYKGSNFSASLTGYKDYFQNTFANYSNPISGLSYQINSGASSYEGLNFSADYQVNKDVGIYGNYSLQDAYYGSDFTNQFGYSVQSGTPKQYTPTFLANIGINARYGDLYGSIFGNLTGPQYIGTFGGSPDAGVSMAGYSTLNISLKYPIKINKYGIKKVNVGLNVENLLGSNSYVFEKSYPYKTISGSYIQAQPMAPRFVGVNLNLLFG